MTVARVLQAEYEHLLSGWQAGARRFHIPTGLGDTVDAILEFLKPARS